MSDLFPQKYPICLCMIVKNEARLLAQVLQSAQPIVSQMVVVDTGSTDQSIEIAKNMGAEVYQHAWAQSFAKARNQSLSYARQPWILILDGDELLDQKSYALFAELDLSPKSINDAYACLVVNYTTDQKLESESHYFWQVRLFKRSPQHGYDRNIHNQIMHFERQIHLTGPQIPIRILHDGYTPSVWALQKKDERLQMLIEAVQADQDDLFAHFNLANHLKILKRYESALSHYLIVTQTCLKDGLLSQDFALDDRREWFQNAFYSGAFCANQLGNFDLGIKLCDQLLEFEPHLADPIQRKIEALSNLKRYDLVIECYENLMKDEDRKAIKQKAFYDLSYRYAIACYQQGSFQKGFDSLHGYFETQMDITVFNYLALFAIELNDDVRFWICFLRAQIIDRLDPDLDVIFKHYLGRSQISRDLAQMGKNLLDLKENGLIDRFWEKMRDRATLVMAEKQAKWSKDSQDMLAIFQMLAQEISGGFSVLVMGGETFLNWDCISQVLGDLPFELRWLHRLNERDWRRSEDKVMENVEEKKTLCFLICMYPDSQFFGGIALVESTHVELIAQRMTMGDDLHDLEINWRYFREVEWCVLGAEERKKVKAHIRSRVELSWSGFWEEGGDDGEDENGGAIKLALKRGIEIQQDLEDLIRFDQKKYFVYLIMLQLIEE